MRSARVEHARPEAPLREAVQLAVGLVRVRIVKENQILVCRRLARAVEILEELLFFMRQGGAGRKAVLVAEREGNALPKV